MRAKVLNNPQVGVSGPPKSPAAYVCLAITRQATTSTPEHELFLAVIKQAVMDLFSAPPRPNRNGLNQEKYWHRVGLYNQERIAWESALRFFEGSGFHWYAESIDLDPDYVLALIRDAQQFTGKAA